jgi:hypothetical protein
VDEATIHRAQAVLDDRVVVSGPRQRNRPDFTLRGFVRGEACGRPLTWRRLRVLMKKMVSLNFASSNQLDGWLRWLDSLRPAA